MNKLKVFTAFSGYDSQCMALDRLGINYDLIGWSEIDKYAIQAHNAIYPNASNRNYGDISKINWYEVSDFDLFTYSFPCTDISNAGQKKGLEEGSGTRSSLLWECKKAIKAKKPKYLLMENVKALTSKKFLPYLKKWLSYLDSIGYKNYTKVLNAKDYGVPQNRERVFVVSILDGDMYEFPKAFELKLSIENVLEHNVDKKYYLSQKAINGLVKHIENHFNKNIGIIGKADNLLSEPILHVKQATSVGYAEVLPGGVFDASYPDSTTRRGRVQGNGLISPTLTANGEPPCLYEGISDLQEFIDDKISELNDLCIETEKYIIGISVNPSSRKLEFKGPKSISPICPALRATDYKGPHTVWEKNNDDVVKNYRIRKLTPRETFRLMGVTDNDIDKIQNAGISRTQQYKMAGNSIVVDVLYHIFRKMFVDKNCEEKQLKLF